MFRTLFAMLILAGVPVWAAADDEDAPDYYPLAEGNKWTYTVTIGDTKVSTSVEVTEVKKKKGKTTATLVSTTADGKTSEEQISADSKGVYRGSISTAKLDKPLTIIKYPVKSGDTWTETLKINGMNATVVSRVGKEVEVKVPAGKFKAYPVKATITLGDVEVTATTWYADKVGIVKQQLAVGDNELLLELKKFTPGE